METKTYEKDWEKIIRQVFEKAAVDKEYADKKINAQWITGLIKGKIIPYELEQYTNRILVPVIERVQVMMRKMDIHKITDEDKKAIGDLVRQKWFENPQKLYLKHVKVSEPTGTYTVCGYPQKFVPVMDAIIRGYFLDNNKGAVL